VHLERLPLAWQQNAMESFLTLCLLVALLAGWVYLRKRLAEVDSPIADLSAQLHRL
jgi:hypothetical protein